MIKNIWLHIPALAIWAMFCLAGCAQSESEPGSAVDPDPWPEPDPDQNTNQDPVVAFDRLRMVAVAMMPGLIQMDEGIAFYDESGREVYLELDEDGRLIGHAVVETGEILYFEIPANGRGDYWSAEVRVIVNGDESTADAISIECSQGCRFGVRIPAIKEPVIDLSLFVAP